MKEKLKNRHTFFLYQRNSAAFICIYLFAIVINLWRCNSNKTERGDDTSTISARKGYYTCAMHPEIVRNTPGTCPICNMDLVLKSEESNNPGKNNLNSVDRSSTSTATFIPVYKGISAEFLLNGTISYDPESIHVISSRTEGRIEKLFVKYAYQKIERGQPLLQLFSHDLLTAQNEYLFLKMGAPDQRLLSAAKEKLLRLGMSSAQIGQLKTGAHVHPTTTIYSPYDGFIIEEEKNANSNISEGSMDNSPSSTINMDNKNQVKINPFGSILKEGNYVASGAPLFNVAATNKVWGVFKAYSSVVPFIKKGQEVIISVPGRDSAIGKISFIEPSADASGTVACRVVLDNKDNKFKIGDFAAAKVKTLSKNALVISSNAFLDMGKDNIVFVKRGDKFIAKRVWVGLRSGDEVEIIKGLTAKDTLAANAGFMQEGEGTVKLIEE